MNGYREYRSRDDMREHGWKIDTLTKECNRCGAEITWATSPNGKKVPLDANSTQLHFKSCSNGGAPPQQPRINSGNSDTIPKTETSNEQPTSELHSLELAVLENAGVTMELTVAIRSLIATILEGRKKK